MMRDQNLLKLVWDMSDNPYENFIKHMIGRRTSFTLRVW